MVINAVVVTDTDFHLSLALTQEYIKTIHIHATGN